MAAQPTPLRARRVTLVTDELLGYTRTGGLGTATSFLAVALGRMGHDVELLYVGSPPTATLTADWERLYDDAGVRIRMLERSRLATEPAVFARACDIEAALRVDPPDVVITQDLAAPAYTALRMRQLGLAFERTLFVVYCHGTRQWITDMARKVRVLPGALAVSLLEQASVELADVVVSPSEYLLEWMQRQGWRLPTRSLVIPYLTQFAATGEAQPQAEVTGDRVERIAFFGRLEERKGIKPFVGGLNALDTELLENIELEFLGSPTPAWPPERVKGLLSETVGGAIRSLSFETDLDQPEALARLSRPGTLAVMPSLEDNSPNSVYECLERGIPFLASKAGGAGELIAIEDRARVLFEPTAEGAEAALRRALSDADALRPARPAFEASTAYEAWAEVLELQPPAGVPGAERPSVDVVVVQRDSTSESSRCRSALARQTYGNVETIIVAGRQAGLAAASSEWVVFLDEEDVPDEDFLETLVRAQAASGADVVTCGVRFSEHDVQRFFLGEPGGLGVLANHYGTAALIRRSLLADEATAWPVEHDPDWPLFARLSVTGAQIVSVPKALVERRRQPGDIQRHPSDALLVSQLVERHLPREVRSLARLAAGLSAASAAAVATPRRSLPRRAVNRLSRELWRR